MRVAFVDLAGSSFPGGCEKYFSNLSKYLADKQAVFFVGSKQYLKFLEYIYHFLSGHKIGSINFVKRDLGNVQERNLPLIATLPFTKAGRSWKKFFKDIDRVYAKNEFQELLLLLLLLGKTRFKEKVIIGVHTPIFVPSSVKGIWKLIHDMQYNSFLYGFFLRNAMQIHVNNSDYINLIANTYRVDKQKIIHISNPIDWKTELFTNSKEKFTAVWIGRFTNQKGIDRLESIINILSKKRKFSEIEILIGGAGDHQFLVDRIINKYSNVKYIGFVTEIEKVYKQADLSLFTAYFDTFAHAVLEPQSYGIPVVSFDIPGPRDIIINDKTGYLVSSEEEFADKLIYYVNMKSINIKNYNKMKKEIYSLINKTFDKETIFQKLEKLF